MESIKMAAFVITQETTDRTIEKTRATKDVITVFTGMPPKDCSHIYGVKRLIENYPHPNVQTGYVCYSGTLPTGTGDVWQKMTDWNDLTPEEQNSTIDFLSERFSADDLELAYDEFYPRFGRLPTVHEYRVFILNWEGRRRKTRSLAQMKRDIEEKDSNIQNLTTNQSNLRMALDHTVNISVNQHDQINNLLSENMTLHDDVIQLTHTKDRLDTDVTRLEEDNRQLRSDVSNRDKTVSHNERVISYLRRDVASRNETIQSQKTQCSELKTKNKHLCNDVTQLTAKVRKLDSDITNLTTENTQKDDTIVKMETEVTQLTTENTQLQTENTQLTTENTQLQTENTQLQTENTQLQTENTQKDGTISQQQSMLKKKDGKITNLKKDNIMLYEELQRTSEISEQKDRQLRIQKMKIDDLSYHMGETGDRIARLEKVNEEKCDEIDRLIGNNNEQAQHIRQQDDVIMDLKERLQEQERINRDLYSQIADLRQLVLQQIEASEE